uniref:Ras family protein n=1 Tax=Heterorhabditis bacteriophora TaxID=37862 RepID=A0A1I7W7S0_HETBA
MLTYNLNQVPIVLVANKRDLYDDISEWKVRGAYQYAYSRMIPILECTAKRQNEVSRNFQLAFAISSILSFKCANPYIDLQGYLKFVIYLKFNCIVNLRVLLFIKFITSDYYISNKKRLGQRVRGSGQPHGSYPFYRAVWVRNAERIPDVPHILPQKPTLCFGALLRDITLFWLYEMDKVLQNIELIGQIIFYSNTLIRIINCVTVYYINSDIFRLMSNTNIQSQQKNHLIKGETVKYIKMDQVLVKKL